MKMRLFWVAIALLCSTSAAMAQGYPPVASVGSPDPSFGIAPVVSASGESAHVLKTSAGNLYSVYATNLTATAGFLIVVNRTTAPSTGAISLVLDCAPLPASGVASISYSPGPPNPYSTGIVALVSSGADCFTYTNGTITAFISGHVK